MTILIVGGAGYIGSILTQHLLCQGNRVRVFDSLLHGGSGLLGVWSHPSFEFVLGDVRNEQAIQSALVGIDAVILLAAIVGDPACAKDPDLARDVNERAAKRLISACEQAKIARFIFASTCSNYGKMDDPTSYVNELSELRPVSLYAETKVAVEGELLEKSTMRMCSTVLRLATVHGVSPRMRFDLTVNEFTAEMVINKHLVVFGEQFWRPYVHVRDVARAMTIVLEAPVEQVNRNVFNVGSTDENYTKQQLVELIQNYIRGATVEYVNRTEDPRDYRVNFEKIHNALNFNVSRTVTQGIQEVATLLNNKIIADFSVPQYRNS